VAGQKRPVEAEARVGNAGKLLVVVKRQCKILFSA